MKKRIIINGYFLSRPFTGFGVYTNGLLKALSTIADADKYEFIVITPVKPSNKLTGPIKFEVIPEPTKYGASFNKLVWEQKILPKTAKKLKAELIHQLYPATAVFGKGIKQLVTIHDATPWHFRVHNKSKKVAWFRKFIVWSNRRADRVVSISNYARNDVADVFRIPKGQIDIAYNGIDNRFRVKVTEAGKEAVRKKYNLPKNYIFYIGGFEAHKNIRKLFLAYSRASTEIKHNLIISGGVFSKARLDAYQDYFDLPSLIKSKKLQDRVKLIGVVPDEDLPALYQAADLFVMPSLLEGFNLPLVQAFASGVPAIAANSPASIEVAGGAAELVDTSNEEVLATAITKLLTNTKRRNELIVKGIERQNEFRWEYTATRLLEIYDEMTKGDK